MADLTGLASGISQGFQLGNNFFNTIDQRQRQNVQDQRNAELFKMQKDQFEMQKTANELTNELNEIKTGAARRQEQDRVRVGELQSLLGDVSAGNYDPEKIVDRLDALDIDLSPIFDSQLKTAINDLGTGKFDSSNPQHMKAVNFLMGKKVQEVVGMTGANGEKIASVRVVDIVPSPTNPEMLVPELAVQTESGTVYRAPITQNRTANPDDPIVQISMDAAIQKAIGTRQLYSFLDRSDLKRVVNQRIKQISAPYTTIQDGFAVNALTGGYEYVKPFKPTQPTKATLAMAATGTGPEAKKAKEALALMNTNKIDSVADLAIAAIQTDDPILKKQYEDAIASIASIEASAKAAETAAAFNATADKQIEKETQLLLEKDRIGSIAAERDSLLEKRREFQESARDLAQVTADFTDLVGTGFKGNIASDFIANLDKLLLAANINIGAEREAQLNAVGKFQASAVKLGLLGLSYFKGAISEKELETAMQLAPRINNLNDVNRWIIKSATSSNAVGRMLVEHQLSILQSGKDSQVRIQEHSDFLNTYGSLPTVAIIAFGNGKKEPMLFSDFYPEYKRFLINHESGDKTKGLSKHQIERLVMDGWLNSINAAGDL